MMDLEFNAMFLIKLSFFLFFFKFSLRIKKSPIKDKRGADSLNLTNV